MEYDIQKLSI